MQSQRGVALLIVIWLMILMIGIIAVFALGSRAEGLQGRQVRLGAQLEYAAESGIEVAMIRMLANDPRKRFIPDGRSNSFAFDGIPITVNLLDETAKIDINVVEVPLLTNLFVALGQEQTKAQELAGAVIDWRDADELIQPGGGAETQNYKEAELPYGSKNRPFESVAELRRILGMDAAFFRVIEPHLTVYTGLAQPNAAFAAEPVLRALGYTPEVIAQILAARQAFQLGANVQTIDPNANTLPPASGPGQVGPGVPGGAVPAVPGLEALAAGGSGTYSVYARAEREDGPMAEINTIVRVGAGGFLGQVYLPLTWRVGDSEK